MKFFGFYFFLLISFCIFFIPLSSAETSPFGISLDVNAVDFGGIGIQAASILNYNRTESSAMGIIVGVLNLTEYTKVTGFEIGLYNKSREIYGVQIGLINRTQNLHGIQIGLLNFNTEGFLMISPGLNVGF